MTSPQLGTVLVRSTGTIALRLVCGTGIGFAGAFIIARIIGAEAYGSYIAALALPLTISAIAQWGVGMALVRAEHEPTRARLDTAWCLLLVIGILASVIGIAVGFLIFPGEKFADIRQALLLMLPVTACTLPATVPLAVLERQMRFAPIAGMELAGSVLWLGTSLGLGLLGWDSLALPLGWVVQQCAQAVAWHRLAGFRPRANFVVADASALLGFGTAYSTAVVSWQVRPLVAPMAVGTVLGMAAVGQVGMASRIMEALSMMRHALWRASAPLLGRLRSNDQATAAVVCAAGAVSCVATAMLSVAFVLCQPLVRMLIGPDWDGALALFPYFAVHGMIAALLGLLALVLHVHGRSLLVTTFNVLHIVLLAGAAMILVPEHGLLGWGVAELVACASFPALLIACPRGVRRHIHGLPALALPIIPIAWFLFSPTLASGTASVVGIAVLGLAAVRWGLRAKVHLG